MAIKEVKFQFRVSEEGDIKIINAQEFKKQMFDLFKGQSVIGEFRAPKKKRTLGQNGFYYAVTIPEITEGLVEAGYDRYTLTPRVVNQFLEKKFLTLDIASSEFAGEYITITKEAKDLNTSEWMKYTDDLTIWSAEFLNIVLSVPLQQKEMDLI